MYFIFLCLLALNPFLSSLFSRAFLYDHKNRKCQWLSFDRNSPGVLSQQDFNYQLYQKKGALHFPTFSPPAGTKVVSLTATTSCHQKEQLFIVYTKNPWLWIFIFPVIRYYSEGNPQEDDEEGQGPVSCLWCRSTLWVITWCLCKW